jgi:hypothetical protein
MDPITIGLAFTAAQSAVGYIKQAIALGKDVNSLAGQFSAFFDNADTVHKAKIQNKAKASYLGKSDAELGKEALDIAMHSDALRESERQLKDMIIWELGKPQIWEQMIKERTRMFKERAAAEKAAAAAEHERKKKIAKQGMFALYFVTFSIVVFAAVQGSISIYGAIEEKKAYELKVTERAITVRRHALERERRELEEYTKTKEE